MFCKFCGNKIDDDSVFCSHCGRQLTGSAQSVRQPPPPEPERPKPYRPPEKSEAAEQKDERHERQTYKNVSNPNSASADAGAPPPKKPPKKYVIPAAIMALIVILFIINETDDVGRKYVYIPRPTSEVSVPSESIPPDLFTTPEPFTDYGAVILDVLTAITERPDYIYGDFEPLIGFTNLNENGSIEVLAVYETKTDSLYEVRYDVWCGDSSGVHRALGDILFTEASGNSGKLHLVEDINGYYAVMLEQNQSEGESFEKSYTVFEFTQGETGLEYYVTLKTAGRYDTAHGGTAEAKYTIDSGGAEAEVSADTFNASLNKFTAVYTLDILSGEYDWDNTLSFDWAWKAFAGE